MSASSSVGRRSLPKFSSVGRETSTGHPDIAASLAHTAGSLAFRRDLVSAAEFVRRFPVWPQGPVRQRRRMVPWSQERFLRTFRGSMQLDIELDAYDLVTVAELARRYTRQRGDRRGVHPSTVTRWIKQGVCGNKLPARREGGQWLTTIRAYKAWSRQVTKAAVDGPTASSNVPSPPRPNSGPAVSIDEQTRVETELRRRFRI